MSQTYQPITFLEMQALLSKPTKAGTNWIDVTNQLPNTKEAVFDLEFPSRPGIACRIYTSIVPTEGVSRASGKDAIRVNLVDISESRKGRPIGKATRTHRVAGWEQRLQTKVIELIQSIKGLKHCPRCHHFMVERQSGNCKFLGCSRFPLCGGTLRCSMTKID